MSKAGTPNLKSWRPGQSGNPAGKPRGCVHKATQLAQALIDSEGEAIVRSVIKAALGGDMQACRLVVERLVPPRRERTLSLVLPSDLASATGISEAAGAILQATAAGELLPSEATALAAILETRRKTIETDQLEQRIAALEDKKP